MADSEKSVSTEQQQQQQPPSNNAEAAGIQPQKVPQAAKEVIGKWSVLLARFTHLLLLFMEEKKENLYTTGCQSRAARHFVLLHNHILVLVFCFSPDFFRIGVERKEDACDSRVGCDVVVGHDIVVWEIFGRAMNWWLAFLSFVVSVKFV